MDYTSLLSEAFARSPKLQRRCGDEVCLSQRNKTSFLANTNPSSAIPRPPMGRYAQSFQSKPPLATDFESNRRAPSSSNAVIRFPANRQEDFDGYDSGEDYEVQTPHSHHRERLNEQARYGIPNSRASPRRAHTFAQDRGHRRDRQFEHVRRSQTFYEGGNSNFPHGRYSNERPGVVYENEYHVSNGGSGHGGFERRYERTASRAKYGDDGMCSNSRCASDTTAHVTRGIREITQVLKEQNDERHYRRNSRKGNEYRGRVRAHVTGERTGSTIQDEIDDLDFEILSLRAKTHSWRM